MGRGVMKTGTMQYPPSDRLWERITDRLAGWLVGVVFKVDNALADLGGDD